MDDFNEKNGELSGFDEAKPESETNGYTVTPDGGFYTRQKQDIIQDEVFTRPEYSGEPESSANTAESTNQEPDGNFHYEPEASRETYTVKPKQDFEMPKRVKKSDRKYYRIGAVILSAVIAAIIGASSAAAVLLNVTLKNTNGTAVGQNVINNPVNINVDETAESVVEAVAQKVTPSVIGIRTTTSVLSFFGGNSESTGEGSGVVYSADGYIITNYHVISGAVSNKVGSKVEVFVDSSDSEPYTATVVGYNISADLAVIKINATGLVPIEFSDSDNLKVGQYVVTVGNPGGLEFMDSVTYGVISGLNRVVSSDSGVELIQTDAAINPGNSGGALVNAKGELVGINSSKIVSEEFEAMGFAIPSNTVKKITKNIIKKENSPEPYIGITLSEKYTAEVLDYYGFPAGGVVLSVAEGSPAYEAGIRKGDIVTEFKGTKITDYTVLEQLMGECTPGETVSLNVYRSGRTYSVKIQVASNNQVR